MEYIEANYNEELYLDSMAEKFNTTPKYLSKMLKQHLGIPFKAYLTQLRISKAEEMLLDKSLKINDISREVGFLNQSSFIRAFKLKNGISPSEYTALATMVIDEWQATDADPSEYTWQHLLNHIRIKVTNNNGKPTKEDWRKQMIASAEADLINTLKN